MDSQRNRYKDTEIIVDSGDRGEYFAPWVPPSDFDQIAASGFQTHRVTAPEVGNLDAVAVRYYGPGNEDLWWLVAWANALIDPEREMYPGMVLRIISRPLLAAYLSR